MDPLDKILSLVLSRTIAAQRAKVSQAASSTSPGGVIIGVGGSSGGVSSNNTVNSTRPSTKWTTFHTAYWLDSATSDHIVVVLAQIVCLCLFDNVLLSFSFFFLPANNDSSRVKRESLLK